MNNDAKGAEPREEAEVDITSNEASPVYGTFSHIINVITINKNENLNVSPTTTYESVVSSEGSN